MSALILALSLLVACGEGTEGNLPGDCSDGIDNDDDGEIDCADVGCTSAIGCDDLDGDGWYSRDDCDDGHADVNPGMEEIWYDGVDQDCDGRSDYDQDGDWYEVDEDCDDLDPDSHPNADEIWYDGVDQDCLGDDDYDQDGDGHRSSDHGGDDCVDTDPEIYTGHEDTWYDGIDSDCDGWSDYDQDHDGHDAEEYGGGDCEDTNADVNPDADDSWYDGEDTNCDDASDFDQDGDGYESADWGGLDCDDRNPDAWPGAPDAWYDGVDANCDGASDFDRDGDGHDHVDYGGDDCNDTDPTIYPGMDETWYDGTDSNCDGWSDYDQDMDGHDSPAYGGDDCDDTDPDISPSAPEIWYDGTDSNCDGLSDDDQDYDGYDAESEGGTDCDDTNPAINPSATEIWYNGDDDDCDDHSDYDQDFDTYDGVAYGGTDCDDTDAAVNTDATELWYDSIDQDCDGHSDFDQDFDTYDDETYGGLDCNDLVATVSPDQLEVCGDTIDNDCDHTGNDCELEGAEYVATASAILTGDASGDEGAFAAATGDLDGDGVPDMVLTSPLSDAGGRNFGTVYAVEGPVTGTASVATLGTAGYGEYGGQGFGRAVAVAGDLGLTDVHLLVGAPYDDDTAYGAGAAILMDVSTMTASYKLLGPADSESGSAVAGGQDFDGDGYAEVFVGAPYESTTGLNAGAVFIVDPTDLGATTSADLATVGVALTAEAAGDRAGVAVLSPGDVDGDGQADLLIGAPGHDEGGADAGSVYIVDTLPTATTTLYHAVGEVLGATGDQIGASLAFPGDVDGDGYGDLLTGAPESDKAYLIAGPLTGRLPVATAATATFTAEHSGDEAGFAVAGGDLDADGLGDLLIGAPHADSEAGAVYLVYGSVSGVVSLADAHAKLQGAASQDHAGSSLLVLDDINSDGYDDVLVGAPGNDQNGSSSGAAYVMLGGSL